MSSVHSLHSCYDHEEPLHVTIIGGTPSARSSVDDEAAWQDSTPDRPAAAHAADRRHRPVTPEKDQT
ncbi:hypothetical protein GCM10023340_00830 [Nocardioides marinquilinus]|uniref:Uncharacterized protein n=1 Tax=Nocardioides marinquilinus TaxID=1210400 RepID=A0ABP9P457_9ACTN